MRRAERESFLKSFGVFFISLAILSGVLAYLEYFKLKHEMQDKIYNEMRVCSYTLKCEKYEFDFVPLESNRLYQLYESQLELFALFSIPKNDTYALKLSLVDEEYEKEVYDTKITVLQHYFLGLIAIFMISALFSFYALYPLKKALHLTQEFSRDILHDLGTPLSALRLNVSRLNVAHGDERKVQRISQSIDTIISLGDNLKSYLEEHEYQKDDVDLHLLMGERILLFGKLYPNIKFSLNDETFLLNINHDAMVRIIDNLLSNAAKYNKPDGFVEVIVDLNKKTLQIKDSGRGILDTKRIFERFYKEQERGVGIGLHIVKKLCDELKITIEVESEIQKGSTFRLNFNKLISSKG